MDTTKLKKFAQFARRTLIQQVSAKLVSVLAEGASAQREHPDAFKNLKAAIDRHGESHVIERVAYIWFNRFTALRFLDVNELNSVRVVSPLLGQFQNEILADAKAENFNELIIPETTQQQVRHLLDGQTSSPDPQAEAYRLLLIAVCNYWHQVMPYLFERIEDYTELLLPADLQSNASILAYIREAMTPDVCKEVEIIGWLYQFYISEKKDQVFAGVKKNRKITAENIPAATQLFTPHWIVRYLVENSLGRLWLLNRPQSRLAERMKYYIAPKEPETDFLRITSPEDIRICDPAAGSGHMLTYAFDLLHAIYEEEGYEPAAIPELILRHNLTGVEIDDRAGALAAFALAMKVADKLGRRRFLRMEAKPDICVLQNVSFTDAEMQDVAAVVGKDLFTGELRETLGQFEQAKNFGSLIVPKLRDPAETLRVVEARDFAGDLLLKEVQARVVAVLRMSEALSPKYHVVVANPPYMGSGNANDLLKGFMKLHFPDGKADLYTAFIERNLAAVLPHGFVAMVTIQNWMFLSTYENLRNRILNLSSITGLIQIGYNSFPELNSKVVQAAAYCLEKSSKTAGSFFNLNDTEQSACKKSHFEKKIRNSDYYTLSSSELRAIPGNPIVYWLSELWISSFSMSKPLGEVSFASEGIKTGNNERFLRIWHEVETQRVGDLTNRSAKWLYHLKGGEFRKWHGNQEYVILWENDGEVVRSQPNSGIQGEKSFKRDAAIWSDVTTSGYCARLKESGKLFDSSSPAGFIQGSEKQVDLLGFLNSCVANQIVPMLNPTLHFKVGNFRSFPFVDVVAPNAPLLITISKSDWDAFETSWDFTTLALLQPDHRAETLEATYTTLRTHWQGMTDEMLTLEEENNRIFIDAYGLQDELTPEVPLNEITLTCNPAYRYGIKNDAAANETRLRADTMAEFLSYAVGCMFGRYSLDAPGLILANQGETLADYLASVPSPQFMPDEDNVIPVLDADWFPDDITERFRLFLRTTFGEAHLRENLRYIEDALGKDIRKYFTKDFYADHVKRYKKRPIYWMFSSPKGTFNALIYMHRYQSDTVSVLLNDYLREFITKLEGERARLDKLADDPTATQGQKTKALKDAGVVAKQIDELNAWEREVIFPLAQQKIEIDLDDGVKTNYPKFGAALKNVVGLSE